MIPLKAMIADRRGNVVVPFSIMGVALVALAGSAIDLLSVHNQRSALQVAVDAGVMAAAHEMAITSNDA